MKIYRAYYDSRSFTFETYSQSKSSARYHILNGLKRHGIEYDLPSDWYVIDGHNGIEIDCYDADTPYRDREKIK